MPILRHGDAAYRRPQWRFVSAICLYLACVIQVKHSSSFLGHLEPGQVRVVHRKGPSPRTASTSKQQYSRRLLLLGILGTAAPPEASLAVPVAFDYRTLDEINRTAGRAGRVGDLTSESVQKAVSKLRERVMQARSFLGKFKKDPMQDVSRILEIKQPDSVAALAAIKSDSEQLMGPFANSAVKDFLMGPLTVSATELKSEVKAISELFDEKTKPDVERVGSIMVSTWYKVAKDPNIQKKNEIDRLNKELLADMESTISEYIQALEAFLSYVE
eukprot:TRINITY_DN107107_c0_g1_i1.p1 TRINITY_DN107107_c0_g1~~TRINITY_DN107107_c0_g1_i1.p1  ORF type:complete len:273 (-),score=45.08 TRINITY_DN107107_c0_g1_i1:26-844(-)